MLATDQSLARLHLRTGSQLAQDEKAAAEAKSQLDALEKEGANGPKVIKAPQEAIVLKINVGIGSVVAPGAQLLELARPNGLVLDAGVIPAHANTISIGDKASLVAVNGSHSASGSVVMKSELVRQSDGLVPIQISLPQGKLKIGQFTEAQITTGRAEGFLVPHAAILVNDKGQTYVVQAVDMTASTVPVEVIGSDGANDVIQGNLTAGNDIVLAGNHQLTDGMHLRTANAKNAASNELAKK
ncbi:MAG: HlyD family efflux transporter periplasmic adaptor subunit [Rhizobiaceae bacterium]|nr:MAG: HlyD family efflux transporter periplasmic adaptor subunit [Rhizobiaceae bacterium]